MGVGGLEKAFRLKNIRAMQEHLGGRSRPNVR
jgi:hypothetical protein